MQHRFPARPLSQAIRLPGQTAVWLRNERPGIERGIYPAPPPGPTASARCGFFVALCRVRLTTASARRGFTDARSPQVRLRPHRAERDLKRPSRTRPAAASNFPWPWRRRRRGHLWRDQAPPPPDGLSAGVAARPAKRRKAARRNASSAGYKVILDAKRRRAVPPRRRLRPPSRFVSRRIHSRRGTRARYPRQAVFGRADPGFGDHVDAFLVTKSGMPGDEGPIFHREMRSHVSACAIAARSCRRRRRRPRSRSI